MLKSEARELMRGVFGKTLLENMMNYVTTITWGEVSDGEYHVFNNGSGFLLNLGAETILVTAAHVYEGYLEAKKINPKLRNAVGDLPFNLEERLIDSLGSKVLDIATFQILDVEIPKLGKHVCYGAVDWPPAAVIEDQSIFFGGYPGVERFKVGPQAYDFGLYVALTPVSSSSERHFACSFERGNWLDTIGKGLPPLDFDMGGMSGGPAFLFKESDGELISWDLIGVLYNATNSMGEIVLFHHAKYIKPDGFLIPPMA